MERGVGGGILWVKRLWISILGLRILGVVGLVLIKVVLGNIIEIHLVIKLVLKVLRNERLALMIYLRLPVDRVHLLINQWLLDRRLI
jgi:hypothetical protein